MSCPLRTVHLALCSLVCGLVLVGRPSDSHAASWTLEVADPVAYSGSSTSLRLDVNGRPRVSEWASSLGVRYATFEGGAWSVETLPAGIPPSPLSDPALDLDSANPGSVLLLRTVATNLALDSSSEPWIVHVMTDTDDYSPQPIRLHHRSAGVWYSETVELGLWRPEIELDQSDRVHLCYDGGTPFSHQLRYAVKEAGVWTYETVDAHGLAPKLRLDAQGRPHVLYLDGAVGALVYAIRTAGSWVAMTVPVPNQVGDYALALHPTLGARIAVTEYSSLSDQATLHYVEQDGVAWRVSTADPSTRRKVGLALALDLAGEPIIAYNDQEGLDLKVATRSGQVWTQTLVDEEGNTGYYASAAVDPLGRPVVAYQTTSPSVHTKVAIGSQTVGVPDVPGGRVARPAIQMLGPKPNPVRVGAALHLSLELEAQALVRIEAFDVAGRRIALRPPEALGAGLTSIVWNPQVTAPGLVFLRASTEKGGHATRSVAILR